MAIVYQHIRKDTNEVFYIGIGKTIARSKSKVGRNNFWYKIVKKYDYHIEIIHENITWEEACELEKFYIKKYGRRDLGLGPLVNMTDGGEGSLNKKITEDTRKKLCISHSGENNVWFGKSHSEETKKKMSLIHTGKSLSEEHKKKISLSQIGKSHSEETKKKLSLAKNGENSPTAKLIENDVIWIRENYIPKDKEFGCKALSIRFNLTKKTIYLIINKLIWKHI